MGKYRLRAYIYLIIAAIISGTAGPVIKLTLTRVPTEVFLLYRFFISSVVVVICLPFIKIKLPKKPGVLINFLIFCFLNSTVALGFLFLGTEKTTLLDMSLLTILGPVVTIFAGSYFLHEHITKKEKMGIFLATLGSFVILVAPFLMYGDRVGQISGNILIIIYMAVGVTTSIMVKKLLRQGADPWSLTGVSFIIGFISFLIIGFVRGDIGSSLSIIKSLPLPYHLGVFYMAVLSGTFAYFIGNLAQRTIEVSEAAIFSYIPSILSAVLAIALLGDKLTFIVMAGTVITFTGVMLAEWKKKGISKTRK